MSLYDALRVLLVDEGPLENLYASRLPRNRRRKWTSRISAKAGALASDT